MSDTTVELDFIRHFVPIVRIGVDEMEDKSPDVIGRLALTRVERAIMETFEEIIVNRNQNAPGDNSFYHSVPTEPFG